MRPAAQAAARRLSLSGARGSRADGRAAPGARRPGLPLPRSGPVEVLMPVVGEGASVWEEGMSNMPNKLRVCPARRSLEARRVRQPQTGAERWPQRAHLCAATDRSYPKASGERYASPPWKPLTALPPDRTRLHPSMKPSASLAAREPLTGSQQLFQEYSSLISTSSSNQYLLQHIKRYINISSQRYKTEGLVILTRAESAFRSQTRTRHRPPKNAFLRGDAA
ncbi:Protein of unknown function [Gryllus bimaculatus]|nr:Protein of unknown function [Gryllus bimaculatus]